MTHEDIKKLLQEAGYDSGWALYGEELTIWQHKEDPPAPLKRPADETPSAD